MAGWLSRWLGGEAQVKAQYQAALSPAAPDAATASPSAPSGGSLSPPSADPLHPIHRFGARRPLVGNGGEVAGFEFRLARNLEQRLQARPDPSARAAYVVALMSSMRSTLESGRSALATVPAEVLVRPQVMEQAPAGLYLVVEPWAAAEHEPEMLSCIATLRSRGVHIGRVAPEVSQNVSVDFVLLSMHPEHSAEFWRRLDQWRSALPSLPVVVGEVDNVDDVERALRAGAHLASGRVDRSLAPVERDARPMPTGTQQVCQLLNEVMLDRDTAQVAQALRADVALSYKLLRYVNSPAVGLSRGVESIDQALMVLGRNELYRWLSVLLLAGADGRKASKALQEIALSRARLLETLAEARNDPASHPPAALFTVGLLSLLDGILQLPMTQVVQPLRLSDAAKQALVDHTGPWAPYLDLAADLERHDMAAATVKAMDFGGIAQVLALSDEAWQWAANVGRAVRAG